MGFKINLKEDTAENIDAGSGPPPPGYYRALVDDTSTDDSGAQLFIFAVKDGPYAGRKVYDRLFSPDNAEDDKKASFLARRVKMFCLRFGIFKEADFGVDLDREPDFLQTLGAEVVIKVINEEYPLNSGKFKAKLDFDGLFNLEHDKIPAAERARLGLPLLQVHADAAKAAADGGQPAKKKRGAKTPASGEPVTADAGGGDGRAVGAEDRHVGFVGDGDAGRPTRDLSVRAWRSGDERGPAFVGWARPGAAGCGRAGPGAVWYGAAGQGDHL